MKSGGAGRTRTGESNSVGVATLAEPRAPRRGAAEGRDEALDCLAKTRAAYVREALAWAHTLIVWERYVTADTLRAHCPVPEGIDPRVVGAILNPRNFRSLGRTKTKRAGSHDRPIEMWGEK